ncbi:MAG: RND family efflux transporter MFP subunit, partial [Candidatus Azotimanducaceae bacterium]
LRGEVSRLLLLQQANLAAKTMVAELVSRRDLAENDYRVSLSRIEQIDESLSRTKIVSPVDAVIVERLRQGGEFAQRGQSVVRVLDPTSLEIQITVPVSYLNRINKSQNIRVQIQDLSFETILRSTVQVGNRLSQTFQLLANVPKEIAFQIVAGQFAEAIVSISEDRRSLFVPRDAVVLRSEGSYVFIISDDNKAKRIGVTLGEGQGALVSVQGELQNGDRVAVRGVERLTDGADVITRT